MKGAKNPLSQLFGVLLQKMRSDLGLNSDEVAQKLRLGGSSYRMVEAGSGVYQPGRALELIQVFNQIEFEPLCRLLVAIQTMETSGKDTEGRRGASVLLSDADPQLKLVFDAIEPTWEIALQESSNKVVSYLETNRAHLVLKEFLTTNRYFGLEKEKRLDFELNSLIEDIPSVYLDFILDSLQSLRKYRLHYFPDDSSSWENDNKYNFTNLYAVILDSSEITNPENFRSFDYNYLWQTQFERLNFILLGEKTDAKKQLKDFKETLKMVLHEKPVKYAQELKRFEEVTEQKLRFKNGNIYKDQLKLMLDSVGEDGTKMFWVFTLKNGNNIGFISNSDTQQVFYGTTLSYKETRDKLNEFKKIWDDIE